jgi:hypothetical protein
MIVHIIIPNMLFSIKHFCKRYNYYDCPYYSQYAILNEACLQADLVADDLARVEETHTYQPDGRFIKRRICSFLKGRLAKNDANLYVTAHIY